MDNRCRRRHHDWTPDGKCARPGCEATKTPTTSKTTNPPESPQPPIMRAPDPKPPRDPLAGILAARAPISTAPKLEEGKPREKSTGKSSKLFLLAPPLIVGGVVFLNQRALAFAKREAPRPPQEAMDSASEDVKTWIVEKWGEGPKLSPLLEAGIALGFLCSGMWLGSSKIKPTTKNPLATNDSPPMPPPKIAPSAGAHDADDIPPPRAHVAGNAVTTTPADSSVGLLSILDNPAPATIGDAQNAEKNS
jgi:hypothetical protein